MKIIKFLGQLSVCGLVASCAQLPGASSIHGISYENARSVPFGTTKSDIISKFGLPDIVVHDSDLPNTESLVFYVNGKKRPRAIFLVDLKSKVLEGKTFYLKSESESKLVRFLQDYPSNNFKIERARQTGHEVPDDIYYTDELSGIYFVLNEGRQEIKKVTWMNPKNNLLIKSILSTNNSPDAVH